MPKVVVSTHLHRFFPVLAKREVIVQATTAAAVVRALDEVAPGVADYVIDERGSLRPHVNVFIDGERVADRRALTDAVAPDATVHILQALSGG